MRASLVVLVGFLGFDMLRLTSRFIQRELAAWNKGSLKPQTTLRQVCRACHRMAEYWSRRSFTCKVCCSIQRSPHSPVGGLRLDAQAFLDFLDTGKPGRHTSRPGGLRWPTATGACQRQLRSLAVVPPPPPVGEGGGHTAAAGHAFATLVGAGRPIPHQHWLLLLWCLFVGGFAVRFLVWLRVAVSRSRRQACTLNVLPGRSPDIKCHFLGRVFLQRGGVSFGLV